MKLSDETVLEPLRLEAADLSSNRRFVKGAATPPEDEGQPSLTQSVLESRGILARPRGSKAAPSPAQNVGQVRTGAPGNRAASGLALKPSVVWVPVPPAQGGAFEVLQKFEGKVLSFTQDSFIARLTDKTAPGPEEEAEIPTAEVTPGDRELVRPGAVFYWVIGYRHEAHGQVSRSSVIRFQRVPAWSPQDIERAKRTAETFLSFLDLQRASSPT